MDEGIFLMKAIILAAGTGSRIRRLSKIKHKCLIKIGEKTLITRLVDTLREFDIKDILIITGYKSSQIEREIKKKAKYLYFPRYRYTNNLQTLLYAKKMINGPFICSFSDVYFDQQIIKNLIKNKNDFCLGIDTGKILKNTMRIIKMGNRITQIGSHIEVSKGNGNFIGIAKFSKNGANKLKKALNHFKENNEDYYTIALEKLINEKNKISFFDCKSLNWGEIDLYKDYIKLKKKYASK